MITSNSYCAADAGRTVMQQRTLFRRRLARTLGAWLLACAVPLAADFWDETDFSAWSDKDVEKMLTDSPWAKKVRIVIGSLNEGALPTLPPVSIPGCGGEQFEALQRVNVTVTWTSALPIKQALVRRAIGRDAPVPPDHQQLLSQDEPYYAVSVVGLPPSFAAFASMLDAVRPETLLKRRDHEPIATEEIQLFRDEADQSIRAVFLFPKSDAITLDHEDVEFITKFGDTDVKKKFKLEAMVFEGQLAL